MNERNTTRILAVETSCDETALSVVAGHGGLEAPQFDVIAETLFSQVDIHKEYGGVYPNLAKRAHQENLVPLLKEALQAFRTQSTKSKQNPNPQTINDKRQTIAAILEREKDLLKQFENKVTHLEKPDIDYIAVTYGPGLEPALWVGINFARALSLLWDIPLIPVNHMEGHVASVLLDAEFNASDHFPALTLLVSGGHTELDVINSWGEYEHIGTTRDDAIGEAFDKVARILGLPYPGGPEISHRAAKHRAQYPHYKPQWNMPRPMIDSDNFDFSFSGIKTAVLYRTRNIKDLTPDIVSEFAREFEDAVIDVLITKTCAALNTHNAESLMIAGGVSANSQLRRRVQTRAQEYGIPLFLPPASLTTDNATMIAMAAYLVGLRSSDAFTVCPDIHARGNARL